MLGPPKARHEVVGKFRVMQDDILLQRRIAEQHVDELAGIVAGGRAAERDAHRERAAADVADRLHLADDLVEDLLVLDRRERHLDALLDRDRLRARFDGARVRADVIDGVEAGHGEASCDEAKTYPSARRGSTTGCLAERQ